MTFDLEKVIQLKFDAMILLPKHVSVRIKHSMRKQKIKNMLVGKRSFEDRALDILLILNQMRSCLKNWNEMFSCKKNLS